LIEAISGRIVKGEKDGFVVVKGKRREVKPRRHPKRR
jgi:hypothetical protein